MTNTSTTPLSNLAITQVFIPYYPAKVIR
jgi:hypothetical protein